MAKYHKITGNESVGTIAGMYGVTPQTLLAANPGVSTLSAGAYLRVPSNGLGANTSAGGAGANQPKMLPPKKEAGFSNPAQNPLDKVVNVFQGIGETLSNIKFKPDSTLGGTRQPYPLYSQNGTQTPTTQQNGNLNAQQIAELNLANARNTFKPSWATSTWNENLSNGNPTPVTPDVFQELVFIRQNGGVPRDASIQIVNSALVAQGYVYNPITKRYDPGGPTGGSAPKTQDNTENGRFSKDSWENYKQKTIARGGKRTWIGRGGNRGGGETQAQVQEIAVGSNTPNSTGTTDSIWRIG